MNQLNRPLVLKRHPIDGEILHPFLMTEEIENKTQSIGKIHYSPVGVWFFVILLFSVKFFNITVVSNIFNGIFDLFIYLFWLLAGCAVLKRRNRYHMLRWRFLSPVVFILLGVLLSFIPAYIYYGQSFFTSFVACRIGFVYLTLPALLLIRPSLKDIKTALYVFSLLFFLLMICDSYLHIPLIAKDEEDLLRMEQLAMKGDFEVNFLGGIQFVAMAFFFSLEESISNLSIKKISLSLFFFLVILLYQNRSTLFSCVLITLLLLVTLSNTKRNIKIKILILFFTILVFAVSSDIWHNLLLETGEQVVSSDYNRNLSYLYFIFEAPKGFLSYILGCGFLSASTTSLMQDMMELGVYNSDVGFVGMWNQFGLIPIVTIIVCCCRSLKRNRPLYLKSNALFILICSITISYFWEISTIVWFTLFLYLMSRDDLYESQKHILYKR